MRRRALQGGHDAVVVVLGIGVGLGEPDHLLVVDALPVDHGADLAIAAAGIEADPAPVQVPPNGLGCVLFRRETVGIHHLEGVLKDVGHEVEVEVPAALIRKGPFQILIHIPVAGHVYLEAPLHPQQGLHQPIEVVPVRRGVFRGAVDEGVHPGDLAVGPLHGEAQGLLRRGQKGFVVEAQGDEAGVQPGVIGHGYPDAVQVHGERLPFFFIISKNAPFGKVSCRKNGPMIQWIESKERTGAIWIKRSFNGRTSGSGTS